MQEVHSWMWFAKVDIYLCLAFEGTVHIRGCFLRVRKRLCVPAVCSNRRMAIGILLDASSEQGKFSTAITDETGRTLHLQQYSRGFEEQCCASAVRSSWIVTERRL
jgi:hypothetical protein